MNFRRTNSGLSNLHLFHSVDAIVFVEGGNVTFTIDQITEGRYNSQANDIKYWQIIFETFEPSKAFHFRAVGSNNTIDEIARSIASKEITHVFVARDRDFDHWHGTLPAGPGIFYTIGYSWENDVWTPPVVFATFKKFSNAPDSEIEALKLIDSEFAKMYRSMTGCVRADAILTFNKADGIPKTELIKVVRPSQTGPPTISRETVRALVRARRLKTRPQRLIGPKNRALTKVDCFGHLLESFGYHLLVHVLKKFCGLRTTPRELLVPAAIDSFASSVTANKVLSGHYGQLFTKLVY
jgi:hypothetical protein